MIWEVVSCQLIEINTPFAPGSHLRSLSPLELPSSTIHTNNYFIHSIKPLQTVFHFLFISTIKMDWKMHVAWAVPVAFILLVFLISLVTPFIYPFISFSHTSTYTCCSKHGALYEDFILTCLCSRACVTSCRLLFRGGLNPPMAHIVWALKLFASCVTPLPSTCILSQC